MSPASPAGLTPVMIRPRSNSVLLQEALLPQTDRTTRCMLHNCLATSCTTNPEQTEVTELEGYSRPTCNKLLASSSTVVDVIHKLDRRRVSLITPWCGLAVAKFFKVKSLRQSRVVHGSILCDPIQPSHRLTDPTRSNPMQLTNLTARCNQILSNRALNALT